jgi:hypothetical protein
MSCGGKNAESQGDVRGDGDIPALGRDRLRGSLEGSGIDIYVVFTKTALSLISLEARVESAAKANEGAQR